MPGWKGGTTSGREGPELIIPRKFIKGGNLDKTIYSKDRVQLQLVGRDFPQEYSDMTTLIRLIACLNWQQTLPPKESDSFKHSVT